VNAQNARSATALTPEAQGHIAWERTDVGSGATMLIRGTNATIYTGVAAPVHRRPVQGGSLVYTVLPEIGVEARAHGIVTLAQDIYFTDVLQVVLETPLVEHVRRPRHLLLPPPGPPLMLPPRRPNIAPLLSNEEE